MQCPIEMKNIKLLYKTVSLTLIHEFNIIRAACQFCDRYKGHTLIEPPEPVQQSKCSQALAKIPYTCNISAQASGVAKV